MHSLLKFLHMLGLALFLGSIPGHVILGQIAPGGEIPPQGVLFARMIVKLVTLAATMPGLVLLVVAGFGLAWSAGLSLRANRWALAHAALGVLALANGCFVLAPATVQMVDLAQGLVDGAFDEARWTGLKLTEDVAGALNVGMAVVAMALGVARLRHRRPVDRAAHGV